MAPVVSFPLDWLGESYYGHVPEARAATPERERARWRGSGYAGEAAATLGRERARGRYSGECGDKSGRIGAAGTAFSWAMGETAGLCLPVP